MAYDTQSEYKLDDLQQIANDPSIADKSNALANISVTNPGRSLYVMRTTR